MKVSLLMICRLCWSYLPGVFFSPICKNDLGQSFDGGLGGFAGNNNSRSRDGYDYNDDGFDG
jgi:hypothetical protein